MLTTTARWMVTLAFVALLVVMGIGQGATALTWVAGRAELSGAEPNSPEQTLQSVDTRIAEATLTAAASRTLGAIQTLQATSTRIAEATQTAAATRTLGAIQTLQATSTRIAELTQTAAATRTLGAIPSATAPSPAIPSATATPTFPATGDTPVPTPTSFLGAPGPLTCRSVVGASVDTYLNQWLPTQNYCADQTLYLRQGGTHRILIRWDDLAASLAEDCGCARPDEMVNAWVTLHAVGQSNSNRLTVKVYRVLRSWDACTTNWQRAARYAEVDYIWGAPGCAQPETDHVLEFLDEIELYPTWPQLTGHPFTWNVTDAVRDWLMNPATNQGLLFVGEGNVSVAYQIASLENPVPAYRPQLLVDYYTANMTCVPDTATPTSTPTATSTATATPTLTSTPGLLTLRLPLIYRQYNQVD